MTGTKTAGGTHRSLSRGKRLQSNMSGQGNPNAAITGAQPLFTLSHSDLHGWIGSSRSARHTGAKREQRNFLVSGWHCFCTRGVQDEACCRTSFMVSCPRMLGRRISVYSMSWHKSRFAGMGLQLLFFWKLSGWSKAYNPWSASRYPGKQSATSSARYASIIVSVERRQNTRLTRSYGQLNSLLYQPVLIVKTGRSERRRLDIHCWSFCCFLHMGQPLFLIEGWDGRYPGWAFFGVGVLLY